MATREPLHHLLRALEEAVPDRAERRTSLAVLYRETDPDSVVPGCFWQVARDLSNAIDRWHGNVTSVLDVKRWNWPKLGQDDRMRPRIDLELEITSQHNLALEWRPTGIKRARILGSDEETDFRRFSDLRPSFGQPSNRLFMIRDWGHLSTYPEEELTEADDELLRGVDALVEKVGDFLEELVEVTWRHRIVAGPLPGEAGRSRNRHVLMAEKTQQIQEKRETKKWLASTFGDEDRPDVATFLAAFGRAEGVFAEASRQLEEEGYSMSGQLIARTVRELYRRVPELYHEHLETPPPAKGGGAIGEEDAEEHDSGPDGDGVVGHIGGAD